MTRVAVLLLVIAGGARAEGATEGRGFFEERAAWFAGAAGTRWQTVDRFRPTFESRLAGDRGLLVATVEARLMQGRDAPARPLRVADYLDVDRLYFDAYGDRVDVRAGRQALHWGSAQFFNPTDPFPEVLLTEPWRPRRGVNAVRVHAALGPLSDVTGVATLDDALSRGRTAARIRTNKAGTDLAAVGAWRGRGDWLAGLDLRGTFGIGWWIEAAVRDAGPGAPAEEVAAGADYSFPVLEKLVTMAQYHRDGAAPAGPATRVRDDLLASVALQVNPEIAVTLAALQNLNDGSGIALPSASWAATDRIEFAAAAQAPFAAWDPAAEYRRRPADVVLTIWVRVNF